MRYRALAIAALALAMLGTPLLAQIGVGAVAPKVEADKLINTDFRSLDELRGRLILYEFFAHWWGPCKGSAAHLNQLVEEYGKRGFVVVGVTAEDEAPTQKFIEDTKLQAVVAIQRSNKTMKEYGFTGYPSSALVAPDGKVVWTGHPAGLEGKTIEENLGGVRMGNTSGLAVFAELPKSLGSTAKKLEKGKLGDGWKALKKAEADQKLDDTDRAMVTQALESVEALAKAEADKAETALGEGRYFDALETWEQLKKHFGRHPVAEQATAKIKELKGDKTKKDEIEAGRRIAKALAAAEAGKSKKAVQTLKTVTTGRLSTTEEATRARKLLEEM